MKKISVVLIDYQNKKIIRNVRKQIKRLPFELEIFMVNNSESKRGATTLTEKVKECWRASTGSYIISLSQDTNVSQYDCGRLLFPLINKEVDLCEHHISNEKINPYSFHRSHLRFFLALYSHGTPLPLGKLRYRQIRVAPCLS